MLLHDGAMLPSCVIAPSCVQQASRDEVVTSFPSMWVQKITLFTF